MTAKVHLNKLAAAERQLKAAIRLFFAEEDELAIHTVASAAYGILKDLKLARGRDEAGDFYLAAIVGMVRGFRKGNLPTSIVDNEKLMAQLQKASESFPADLTRFNYAKYEMTIPDALRHEFWRSRNKIANFLKHADRDSDSNVALADVDNFALIAFAVSAYGAVGGGNLGREGEFFAIYCSAEAEEVLPEFHDIAAKLRTLKPQERRKACSIAMAKSKAKDKSNKGALKG